MPSHPPRLLGLRVLVWRVRVPLLVIGALLAALLVARTAAPPPPATEPVVVLARDVEAGTALTAADLTVRAFPRCCAPGRPLADADDLVGRSLAVPGAAGLPVVDELLAGDRFEVEPPDGAVVVPVRLAGTGVALLRPGDRIDLVVTADPWTVSTGPVVAGEGAGGAAVAEDETAGGGAAASGGGGSAPGGAAPGGTLVLARGALVVEVPEVQAAGALGLSAPAEEPAVVVAVSAEEGRALAAGSAGAALGAVLVG